MKLFSFSTVFPVAGAVIAGALLFWTSQSVQKAEDELSALHRDVKSEEQAIRVMKAEWDYLNRPDRLEALAAEYLDLSSSNTLYTVSDDGTVLPDPFIPVLPQHKPLFDNVRPANFQSAGEESE